MEEAAVVTLTCPQCGGQVHGVNATDHDQTVACSYCGTELHIPKIGGDVVHERVVVVEKPVPAAVAPPPPDLSGFPDPYEPADMSLRPGASTGARLMIAFVGIAVIIVAFLIVRSSASDDLAQMHRRDHARDTCRASCKQTCKDNPSAYGQVMATPQVDDVDDPDMRSITDEVNRQLRESNEALCETSCETERCASI